MWDTLFSAPVLTFAAAIAATLGGIVTVIITTRAGAKKDLLSSVDAKMNAFVDQLQEERKDLSDLVAELRDEIGKQQETIDRHRTTIDAMFNSGEDTRIELRKAKRRCDDLERLLIGAGLPVPDEGA